MATKRIPSDPFEIEVYRAALVDGFGRWKGAYGGLYVNVAEYLGEGEFSLRVECPAADSQTLANFLESDNVLRGRCWLEDAGGRMRGMYRLRTPDGSSLTDRPWRIADEPPVYQPWLDAAERTKA